MDLLEALRQARQQTAGTLETLDSLVERVTRLTAALAPEGSGPTNGASGPGIHRATLSPDAPTREKVLALLDDWTTSRVVIDALKGQPSRTALHSMLGLLLREGVVERRGTPKRSEFRRIAGAKEPEKRRIGESRQRILAAAADWIAASKLHRTLQAAGMSHGQIQSGINRLIKTKALKTRGSHRSREYIAKG